MFLKHFETKFVSNCFNILKRLNFASSLLQFFETKVPMFPYFETKFKIFELQMFQNVSTFCNKNPNVSSLFQQRMFQHIWNKVKTKFVLKCWNKYITGRNEIFNMRLFSNKLLKTFPFEHVFFNKFNQWHR